MKKKSPIKSLKELEIVMNVGNKMIEELKKKFPKLKLGEPYKGKFLPYITEYVNTFIAADYKVVKKNNMEKLLKTELWQEAAFIECFCKWLDEEKGVVPKKKKL